MLDSAKASTTWRVIDLINWAENYFSKRGFESPRLEIEWLLRDLLKCNRVDLYLRFEEPLIKSQLATLHTWVKRRINHEPLQYITRSAEFYGLTLFVNPSVLIPRPETERVVDVAIHAMSNRGNPRILDVGTGSGCIALALARELPKAEIIGIDVSEETLAVAKENAGRLGIKNVFFEKVNILESRVAGSFDLLVSNPPYISADEMSELTQEVREHEPLMALTDQADGFMFYRRFATIAPRLIKPGGYLVMEVGLGEHPRKVSKIFNSNSFTSIESIQDYNGDDRVLKVLVK